MAEVPSLDIAEEIRSLQLDSADINGVINPEDAKPEEIEEVDEMEEDSNDKVTVSSQEVQAKSSKVKDKEVPAPDAVEAPAEMEEENKKRHLNVVFIGHVDAGKSTTGGQILFLSGQVDDRTIQKYEKEAKDKSRESWYMAYIMDTNEEERVKGKTVEVGRAHFETETTRFTILDAPGHKSYVPNMISGASQADIGVLVISARKGEFETGYERGGQTREHVQLAKTLGVSKLLVVVNKMDDPTVNWAKERYDEIESKMIPFLKSSGYNVKKDVQFLPISGLLGANMKTRMDKALCPWWSGPCLFEALDAIEVPPRDPKGPFRVLVMEPEESEIDEFERALESTLNGSTGEEEDDNEEGEYSEDDEEEDEEEEEEDENALDSMEQNQQFERLDYEALAEKRRKELADAKSEGSGKRAREEDMTGASLAEIEEIMNFGMRKKRRRRMPKRRGRRKGSKNKLSPEITRMLGDATLHYAHGHYEEALSVLSEVVRRAPLVADSYHTLGLVHKALGNTEKAMKFYRIAAFLRPKDSSLWKLLFSWHIEQRDIARAWKCLSKAISADPDDISLRSLHALFYDELGDRQRAAESYEQIVRICPEDVEAIKTAAKIYLSCGQIKRSVGILEDYLKGHPSEADLSVINLLADVFMEIDAHNNALLHIEHAHLVYYPGKELPLELKIKAGICHVFLGNIEKAEIHFSALQPENLSVHPELITKVANAFMSTEHFHHALKYYHMLESNVGADNEGDLCVKIAQCYLSLNDQLKAIMFFYKALSMLKDSIDARLALASLILEDAKEDEAISLLSPPKDLDSVNSNSNMQKPWWLDGKIKLKLCHIYKAKGMLEEFVNTILPLVRESLYVKTLRPKVKKRLTISVLRERISILNVQENDDVFGEVRPLASKSDLMRASRARKLLQKKEEQKAADKAAGIDLHSDYSDDESLQEIRVSPLHNFLKDEAHHDLIIDLCKALKSLQRYSEALEIINLTQRLVSDKLPGDKEEELQSLLAQISFNATDPKHGFDYVRSAIQKQPHSIAGWNCYYKIASRLGKSHSKHAKFLRYMRSKHKNCVPPIIISAHQFTMLSHHQDAAREYLEAYKLMPECPLINVCVGTALINLTLGFRLQNKHQCLAQGLAFLYNNLQLTENSQEALYNIARAYHHVGLVSLAASYYEKVLATCQKDYPIPKLMNENSDVENLKPGYCDLRREAAYNLHLIYKNSGSFDLAREAAYNLVKLGIPFGPNSHLEAYMWQYAR